MLISVVIQSSQKDKIETDTTEARAKYIVSGCKARIGLKKEKTT